MNTIMEILENIAINGDYSEVRILLLMEITVRL